MLKKLKEFFRIKDKDAPTSLFVSPDDYQVKIEVKMGEMYETAKDELRDAVAKGNDPDRTKYVGLYNIFSAAQNFTDYDWSLVVRKPEVYSGDFRRRAFVLNILRLWWTEKNHILYDHKPMYVKILEDKGWED